MSYKPRTADITQYCQVNGSSEWDWIEQDRLRTINAHLGPGQKTQAAALLPLTRPGLLLSGDSLVNAREPKRVLIVHNGDGLLQFVVRCLQTPPVALQLATASDGYDAECQVTSFNPDLIILDLTIPGLDGYQFCRRLKDNEESEHIKVLVVAETVTSEEILLTCSGRADGIASRPLSAEAMRETAYALLGVKGKGAR